MLTRERERAGDTKRSFAKGLLRFMLLLEGGSWRRWSMEKENLKHANQREGWSTNMRVQWKTVRVEWQLTATERHHHRGTVARKWSIHGLNKLNCHFHATMKFSPNWSMNCRKKEMLDCWVLRKFPSSCDLFAPWYVFFLCSLALGVSILSLPLNFQGLANLVWTCSFRSFICQLFSLFHIVVFDQLT